jgi:hypothetical protein
MNGAKVFGALQSPANALTDVSTEGQEIDSRPNSHLARGSECANFIEFFKNFSMPLFGCFSQSILLE